MKRNNSIKNVLAGLVCGSLALVCCTTVCDGATKKSEAAAPSSEAGSPITVNRTASVGSGVFVGVSVDGKRVKTLMKGSIYKGTLSPGKHVISIVADPNTSGQREVKVEVTAEKDRAYSFVVSRDKSGQLALTKNP